ncbi:MAG: cytochrome P450 [Cyanobium sp.]
MSPLSLRCFQFAFTTQALEGINLLGRQIEDSIISPLAGEQANWWSTLPVVSALAFIALLFLARIPAYWSGLSLLLHRFAELSVRLLLMLGALIREFTWIDPHHRQRRHERCNSHSEDDRTLLNRFISLLVDVLALPLDWLATIGLFRLFQPDPETEFKERRRHPTSQGLLHRLHGVIGRHANLYLILSFLRLLLPRMWLPAGLWMRIVSADSYAPDFPISSMIWLTLDEDVRDVLARPDVFEVIYGPRMRAVTAPVLVASSDDMAADVDAGNFLLGMQDTPRYTRDSSNMRLAFRREDSLRCSHLAERAASEALRSAVRASAAVVPFAAHVNLDLPSDLVIPAVEALIRQYFGISIPLRIREGPDSLPQAAHTASQDQRTVEVDYDHRWLASVFNYLFYDLKGHRSYEDSNRYAPKVRLALQQIIQRRKRDLDAGIDTRADDVLTRCLRLQQSGTPGMDDETLRINLTGFLVGAITPLINATCQVVDVLLDRPKALCVAQAAALAGDHERLLACVMEALRFSPGDPVIYRWSNCDTWIGSGANRCAIPRQTLVMAWNASAMFDPALVRLPWMFRLDRQSGSYWHWGDGQHKCAGAYINMAVIPAILAPLLRQRRLSRAPGLEGRPSKKGLDGITIRHFGLQFRPGPDA